MEDQPNKIKTSNKTKRVKGLYAIACVVIFAAAVFAVTMITSNKNDQKNQIIKVAQVRITSSGFEPSTVVVDKGSRVVWVNADNKLHQVASNPYPKDNGLAGLKSEILNNNQTYQYTANKTGTFGYHDEMQPTVNGTLEVK